MPHFAVIRKDREATRLRIVFDGSAKTADRDYYFNDCLETGQNSLPQLFDVLTSFRSNLIAFTSDVEKAFLHVSVKADDRDTLRFFWYETDSNGELRLLQLRFNRLVFGLTPSPAILGGVVQHHLEKYEQSEPEVIDQLRRQIYVDDFPGGSDTAENAFQLCKKSKEIMKARGMNLRKFKSNSMRLIERLNSERITDNVESLNCKTPLENSESKLPKNETLEDDTSYVRTTVGPQQISENSSATKVLGMCWDTDTDQFYFDFSELIHYASSLPMTKRSVLKLTGRVFDPLGFLSPVMIRMKTIFQNLCQQKINWDAELEGDLRSKYCRFISELQRLSDVRIPLCLFQIMQLITNSMDTAMLVI